MPSRKHKSSNRRGSDRERRHQNERENDSDLQTPQAQFADYMIKGAKWRDHHFGKCFKKNPNKQDEFGKAVLHYIVNIENKQSMEAAILCMNRGADADLSDANGRTSFDIALEKRNYDMALCLLKECRTLVDNGNQMMTVVCKDNPDFLRFYISTKLIDMTAVSIAIEAKNSELLFKILDE